MSKNKKNISILLIVLGLIITIPYFITFCFAFIERWSWPNIIPDALSLRAFDSISRSKDNIFSLSLSSSLISMIVSLICLPIATLTSLSLTRYNFIGKKIAFFLTILPFMIPGTVFALCTQPTFIKLGLNNTIGGVIIVHIICSLPYTIRIIMESMLALGNRFEEQACVLGSGKIKAFYKTTLPILLPAYLSAFAMSFVVSFSQYFLTLIIGGGKVKTLSIVMVPFLTGAERNIASAYSVIFLAITMIVFALCNLIANKISRNMGTELG